MSEPSAHWLITGASAGFGREIALCALARGARVTATARNVQDLEAFTADGAGRALALALDVTDARAIETAVAESQARLGGADVLVNAAGYGFIGAVEETDDVELRQLFETHFFGAAALVRAVLPGMRARERGHIFNFSSVGGAVPGPGTGAYAAAKCAIEGLSEALAHEARPCGIGVTIVQPGPFQTSFFKPAAGRTAASELGAYAASVGPYRRLMTDPPSWCPGDPRRAAALIVDLALRVDAPLRLPLGAMAAGLIEASLERRLAETRALAELASSADFPEAAGRSWP